MYLFLSYLWGDIMQFSTDRYQKQLSMQADKQQVSEMETEKGKAIISSLKPRVKQFYDFHGVQLLGCEFPPSLIESLYLKLKNSVYDAGQYFDITDNEAESSFEVHCKRAMAKDSNVFIIDHALTFRYPDLKKTLKENPKIIERLLFMLKYYEGFKQLPWQHELVKEESLTDDAQIEPCEVQFDNMNLTQISHLQFPKNTMTLSLIGNLITDQKQIIKKIEYLNLKVLWLNENPVAESESLREFINEKSKIELYNSKVTKHCTEWGLKYAQHRSLKEAHLMTNGQVFTLNLDGRDVYQMDPSVLELFPNLRLISLKEHAISTEQHRKYFIKILSIPSLRNVFVDYEAQLEIYKLYEKKLIGDKVFINKHHLSLGKITELDNQIEQIQSKLFKISGCYRLVTTNQYDETSIWYVNDELGSAITHSDRPNVKMAPFLYSSDNKIGENMIACTIIWPIDQIKQNGLIERDFLHGLTEEKQRSSRLSVWYKLPKQYYHVLTRDLNRKMGEANKNSVNILSEFYKKNAEKQKQYIDRLSENDDMYHSSHKLISNDNLVIEHLSDKRIQIITELQKASVVWMSDSLSTEQEWEQYKDKYYFNQFPYESCVVNKKNLADTVQTVFGDTSFLMRTYDLNSQLPAFLGDYYKRETQGADNLWIVKPPNMARSLDMIITDNLPAIVKSMETGPKIVQKYISQPVLRQGRKVDLRYIIAVKSVLPLTMFIYRHFWIRSSNNTYTTDKRTLEDYETQFTVMNYGTRTDFKQISYKDFIVDFEKDYNTKWNIIHQKIKKMLRLVFIASAKKCPQMQNDKSRAIYGVDIMVDSENMQPKLLEITFAPDCNRACKQYPDFYNQVFATLFFDEVGENMERII